MHEYLFYWFVWNKMSWTWNLAAPDSDQVFSVNVGRRRIPVCWVLSEKMPKEWKFPIWVPGKISAGRMENFAKMFELFPPPARARVKEWCCYTPPYWQYVSYCINVHKDMEGFDAFIFFPFFCAFLFCMFFFALCYCYFFFFHLYFFSFLTNSWVFLSQKIQHHYFHTMCESTRRQDILGLKS